MTELVRQVFNRAHHTYDSHANLQNKVGNKLIKLLKPSLLTHPVTIIDLGCGTGHITQQLASQLHYQEFYAIDIAEQLLNIANDKLKPLGIHTQQFDFHHSFKFNYFHLVFSNMALQWSTNFYQALIATTQSLHQHGILAFSLPLDGTFIELNGKFSLNKFFPENEIKKYLNQLGYDLATQQSEKIIYNFPHTLAALRSIKNVGANFVREKKTKHLQKKSLLQHDIRKLTYNIGYFIGYKR